jgi:hypothetical protein
MIRARSSVVDRLKHLRSDILIVGALLVVVAIMLWFMP